MSNFLFVLTASEIAELHAAMTQRLAAELAATAPKALRWDLERSLASLRESADRDGAAD